MIKLEFWKTCICQLINIRTLKDFSNEIIDEINGCDLNIYVMNELCQHLEDLYNSVSKYLQNEQCRMLQNHG